MHGQTNGEIRGGMCFAGSPSLTSVPALTTPGWKLAEQRMAPQAPQCLAAAALESSPHCQCHWGH
jgi:hypothetical protein